MTAHGAGTRARGIDKHRIEQDRLTKHGIERREDRIELAGIARDRANTLDTGLMQTREILIALAVVQIERGVLTRSWCHDRRRSLGNARDGSPR